MSDPLRPAGPDPAADGPMRAAKTPAGLAEAVRDQASSYADRRKTEAAGFLADLARSIRSGGGGLDEDAQVRPFVHAVADNLDVLSNRVGRGGWRELYRDAEAVARGNPLATAIVAGAVGFGAFHVLRAGGSDARKVPTGDTSDVWGGYP